jgi:hypothetical protein
MLIISNYKGLSIGDLFLYKLEGLRLNKKGEIN